MLTRKFSPKPGAVYVMSVTPVLSRAETAACGWFWIEVRGKHRFKGESSRPIHSRIDKASRGLENRRFSEREEVTS